MAHGLTISRREIEHAEHLARRALAHRDPSSPAAASKMGKGVQALETIGAAFVSGVAKGKWGPMSIGPVPVDALAAVLLGGLGIFGPKSIADHSLNIGIGLGSGYAHAFGAGLGATWGASSSAAGPRNVKVSGALGRGNAPLTEAEMRAFANAVR